MHCLDTSALVDYLEGVATIGEFLEANRQPYFAPSVALHEVFVGAARLRGDEGVAAVLSDLDWIEPLPLTVDGAAEAARIDAELHGSGTPIGAMDTLVAGVVREAGATLVTADAHFGRVDGVDVIDYRDTSG